MILKINTGGGCRVQRREGDGEVVTWQFLIGWPLSLIVETISIFGKMTTLRYIWKHEVIGVRCRFLIGC